MPMFSFNKSSCKTRLMQLLQDEFFKVSWRNKVIAKWVAGRLGYKGIKMNSYVRNFILSCLMMPGDQNMLQRIMADFESENIPMKESEVLNKIKSVEERMINSAEAAKNISADYLQ